MNCEIKLGDGAEGHYTRVYVTCQI